MGQKQYRTVQKTLRWSIVWICFGWPRPSVCLCFFWSVLACQKNVYFGRPMPGLFFLFWWTFLRYGFSDIRPGRILGLSPGSLLARSQLRCVLAHPALQVEIPPPPGSLGKQNKNHKMLRKQSEARPIRNLHLGLQFKKSAYN